MAGRECLRGDSDRGRTVGDLRAEGDGERRIVSETPRREHRRDWRFGALFHTPPGRHDWYGRAVSESESRVREPEACVSRSRLRRARPKLRERALIVQPNQGNRRTDVPPRSL